MAVTKIKPIKSTLSKALDYIQNPDKTDGKMLVSSFGCSYETADIEFGFTLAQAIEKGNNLAHHLIQSFEPGEVDYEKAHEIGKQLADAVDVYKRQALCCAAVILRRFLCQGSEWLCCRVSSGTEKGERESVPPLRFIPLP